MKKLLLHLLGIDDPAFWRAEYERKHQECIHLHQQARDQDSARQEAERQASHLAREVARLSKELQKTQARLALREEQFRAAAQEGRRAGKTHTNKTRKK